MTIVQIIEQHNLGVLVCFIIIIEINASLNTMLQQPSANSTTKSFTETTFQD